MNKQFSARCGFCGIDSKEVYGTISSLIAQRDRMLEYLKELSDIFENEYSVVDEELENMILNIASERGIKYNKKFKT